MSDFGRQRVDAPGAAATRSFMTLPALNPTTLFGGTMTFSPVLGFRAFLAFLGGEDEGLKAGRNRVSHAVGGFRPRLSALLSSRSRRRTSALASFSRSANASGSG